MDQVTSTTEESEEALGSSATEEEEEDKDADFIFLFSLAEIAYIIFKRRQEDSQALVPVVTETPPKKDPEPERKRIVRRDSMKKLTEIEPDPVPCCQRITADQYDKESLEKYDHLKKLLRSYTDNTVGLKPKLRIKIIEQLVYDLQFRDTYPHVFRQEYGDRRLQLLKQSLETQERRKQTGLFKGLKKRLIKF